MDIFYKPPLQADAECKALEMNYMNCMMQKALGDRVDEEYRVKDYILWYHLECPKWVEKWDDPNEFRGKWRNWFTARNHEAKLFSE